MPDTNDDISRSEFEALKERVATLEEKLENDSVAAQSDFLDKYDEFVVGRVENVSETSPRRLMKMYDKAGIVNRGKKKQRAKRLHRLAREDEL